MIYASVLGLCFGLGLWLVFTACWDEPQRIRKAWAGQKTLQNKLLQAGLVSVKPESLILLSTFLGLIVSMMVLALTGTVTIAVVFGIFALFLPFVLLQWQLSRRRTAFRGLWPDAVDHLRSATRAGLTLPEALIQLGTHGPQGLQSAFREFSKDYRSGMDFNAALFRLQERLGDPVADRLCAALRLTREVGGTELGQLLATLATFLRDDSRTRHELEARQSWTVNGARLAVAAPWIVLLLVCLQPAAAQSYQRPEGALLLLVGMVICIICYRLMIRIGSLPTEERLLRE